MGQPITVGRGVKVKQRGEGEVVPPLVMFMICQLFYKFCPLSIYVYIFFILFRFLRLKSL